MSAVSPNYPYRKRHCSVRGIHCIEVHVRAKMQNKNSFQVERVPEHK